MRFHVVLDRVFRVLGGVHRVTMRQVRMLSGLPVIFGFMMRRGFVVVTRSVLVMLCCLLVMIGCYL